MDTIGDLGERKLIRRLTNIIGYWGNSIIEGSDDAVAIPKPQNPDEITIINTDMLVSTTDVPPQMNLFQAGRKSIIMASSDIYVKGVIPKWAIISLGLPSSLPLEGENGFDGLIKGINQGCLEHEIQYIGGDLNETKEIVISATILGHQLPKNILKRSSAEIDDLVVTTGTYGLTGLGLYLLLDKKAEFPSDFDVTECIKAVLMPSVDSEIGPYLATQNLAHASADSSDGLVKTLNEICDASGVGMILNWDKIPIANSIKNYEKLSINSHEEIQSFILAGGEEFNHIFTIPRTAMNNIDERHHHKLTIIGKIVSKEKERQMQILDLVIPFKKLKNGFNHFKK
jgi:thiamine-monophosphate kinase